MTSDETVIMDRIKWTHHTPLLSQAEKHLIDSAENRESGGSRIVKKTVATMGLLALLPLVLNSVCAEDTILPGTKRLTLQEPLDRLMVRGINQFCMRELERSRESRKGRWQRVYSSVNAYEESVAENRKRLSTILGAVDPRLPAQDSDRFHFERLATLGRGSLLAVTPQMTIQAVRWSVLEGVSAEGLLLKPVTVKACVVALPDADWSPEMFSGLTDELPPGLQLARRLADHGCLVVVPTLINRQETYSGHPAVGFTNQPHREFVYRQSFQLGRHVIGYEVQKIMAAVDLLQQLVDPGTANSQETTAPCSIGLLGVGEGGLLAFYASALDRRIQSTLVSGYFEPREGLWKEPVYRNLWGLLREFGDAEIASLIAPRRLTIEASQAVAVVGPPVARMGRRASAAPGRIRTPSLSSVREEFERATGHYFYLGEAENLQLVVSGENGRGPAGSRQALQKFLAGLGMVEKVSSTPGSAMITPAADFRQSLHRGSDWVTRRQYRQLKQLQDHAQNLMQGSFRVRDRKWQVDRSSLKSWQSHAERFRLEVHEEVIGRINQPRLAPNARTRRVLETEHYVGYEVMLDVFPDVIAGGILLLPKTLRAGERRPVVVCQHGLEGMAQDTMKKEADAFRFYKGFADELCRRGFIVYAPQNPYRGKDRFRVIQRMANPVQRSLFSFIVAQHEQTLEWLASLSQVDAKRIAFYGLSYGGKTAMRVPPLVQGYCLSICSGDFTDWVRVITTNQDHYGYCFTGEYEIPEWNIGHVASYAELAMLMSPRPFMVEQGHRDGGTPTEWVAGEFGKVRRHYDFLQIGERAVIEFFDGPHTINGQGTYRFLHRHLGWPLPDGETEDP